VNTNKSLVDLRQSRESKKGRYANFTLKIKTRRKVCFQFEVKSHSLMEKSICATPRITVLKLVIEWLLNGK